MGSLIAKVSTYSLRPWKVVTPQTLATVTHWGYVQYLLEKKYKNGTSLCLSSTLQFPKPFNTFFTVPVMVSGEA